MMAITLYRNWRALRSVGRSGGVDPQLLIRVMAFGLYIFSGMTCVLVFRLVSNECTDAKFRIFQS